MHREQPAVADIKDNTMSTSRDEIIALIAEDPAIAASSFVRLQIELFKLQKDYESKQAELDSVMLEYCPDEMSKEQMANWEAHQVPMKDNV